MPLQLAKFLGRDFGYKPPPETEFVKKIHKAWGSAPRNVADAELHAIRWIRSVAGTSLTPEKLLELIGKACELVWSSAVRAYSPISLTVELRDLMKQYGLAP